jgi:hypothetical protein
MTEESRPSRRLSGNYTAPSIAEWAECIRPPRLAPEERAFINSHPETVVGWMNGVDRAIANITGNVEFRPPKKRAA